MSARGGRRFGLAAQIALFGTGIVLVQLALPFLAAWWFELPALPRPPAETAAALGRPDPAEHFRIVFGTSVVGSSIVVGIATAIFARRLLRPIRALASAAAKFGGGDLGARVRSQRADELGDLGGVFDRMAEQTGQLIRDQQRLLGDVAHELRTPLARMQAVVDLMAVDPTQVPPLLAEIGRDLGELSQIVDDILTTARLELAGAGTLRAAPADLVQLARRSADRFGMFYPGRPLELALPEAAPIEADARLLRRVIDNLLDNAAKYSPDDRAVRLELRSRPDAHELSIIDRGIGIAPAQQARLFVPFARLDDSRTRALGGVGLGLTLARQIARAHGGDVVLASELGRGCRATLVMPARAGP